MKEIFQGFKEAKFKARGERHDMLKAFYVSASSFVTIEKKIELQLLADQELPDITQT